MLDEEFLEICNNLFENFNPAKFNFDVVDLYDERKTKILSILNEL
jgi:hypothetical protein